MQSPKEIKHGRNEGRIEVVVNAIKQVGDSWQIVARPIILNADQIHGYQSTT